MTARAREEACPAKTSRADQGRSRPAAIRDAVSGVAQPAPGLHGHRMSYLVAGFGWALSSTWLLLKDAGWLGVIGVICVGTAALSSFAAKSARSR